MVEPGRFGSRSATTRTSRRLELTVAGRRRRPARRLAGPGTADADGDRDGTRCAAGSVHLLAGHRAGSELPAAARARGRPHGPERIRRGTRHSGRTAGHLPRAGPARGCPPPGVGRRCGATDAVPVDPAERAEWCADHHSTGTGDGYLGGDTCCSDTCGGDTCCGDTCCGDTLGGTGFRCGRGGPRALFATRSGAAGTCAAFVIDSRGAQERARRARPAPAALAGDITRPAASFADHRARPADRDPPSGGDRRPEPAAGVEIDGSRRTRSAAGSGGVPDRRRRRPAGLGGGECSACGDVGRRRPGGGLSRLRPGRQRCRFGSAAVIVGGAVARQFGCACSAAFRRRTAGKQTRGSRPALGDGPADRAQSGRRFRTGWR